MKERGNEGIRDGRGKKLSTELTGERCVLTFSLLLVTTNHGN